MDAGMYKEKTRAHYTKQKQMGVNQYLVNIRGMDRMVHFTANGSQQDARGSVKVGCERVD